MSKLELYMYLVVILFSVGITFVCAFRLYPLTRTLPLLMIAFGFFYSTIVRLLVISEQLWNGNFFGNDFRYLNIPSHILTFAGFLWLYYVLKGYYGHDGSRHSGSSDKEDTKHDF